MRKIKFLVLGLLLSSLIQAQESFPVNGVADKRNGCYAFTNAKIVKDAQNIISNGVLIIKEGKIISVGASETVIPKEAVVIDCNGKYIYPSFIDIYSDYGVAAPTRERGGFNFNAPAQLTSNNKGAYGWNQAIHPETDAAKLFNAEEGKAKSLRDIGFGTVLTHLKDGIARGTGVVVTLANDKENLVVVKDKASAHYSFSKGTSTQSYPSSSMGSIALLRQNYLDAKWYESKPSKEGLNLSLQAWNNNQGLPQIFEAEDKWSDLRADRIGKEFGVQYIIKGGGNEYQRVKEIAATKATYIIGLNFPQAMDVEDPSDARAVSLADMKHWELAPTNPAAMEKAGIPFCFTTADSKALNTFMANLRKAIEMGLSETRALEALTKTPATILGIYDAVGSIEAGKRANFIISSGPIFSEKTTLLQNWVDGNKYGIKEDAWYDIKGNYTLSIHTANGPIKYMLDVKNTSTANIISKDTLTGKFSFDGKMVKLSFSPVAPKRAPARASANETPTPERSAGRAGGFGGASAATQYRLSGVANGNSWSGTGEDTAGQAITWTAVYDPIDGVVSADSSRKKIGRAHV